MNGGVELKSLFLEFPVASQHKRDPLLWRRNWVFLNGNSSIFHLFPFSLRDEDGDSLWWNPDENPSILPWFPISGCRVLVKEINGPFKLIAVKCLCKTRLGVNMFWWMLRIFLWRFGVTFAYKYPWKCNKAITFLISPSGNVRGNFIWDRCNDRGTRVWRPHLTL